MLDNPLLGRPARAPGDPDGDRPQGDLRQAVRGQAAGRRRPRSARSTRCTARRHATTPTIRRRRRSCWTRRASAKSGTACASNAKGERLSHRDDDHRRQPRARAGGAGDPEPAAPGRHRAALKAEPPRIFSEALNRRQVRRASPCMPGCSSPRACRARRCIPRRSRPAENGWSGQNYPGYAQSRHGQGARRRRARARLRQAPRPVRRYPAPLCRRPAGAADVLPRRSLRDPQAAQGRACRPATSTARPCGSSSGAGRTRWRSTR